MANQWNRSSSKDAAGAIKAAPRLSRGLLAGLSVVVVGLVVAVCFFFAGSESDKEAVTKDRGLIKEVKPAVPKKSAAELEKEAHPGMVKVRGKWYPEYNKEGGKIWVSKYWVRYHSPTIQTNDLTKKVYRIESKVFDNHCDREIAVLLNSPPGAMRIGPANPYNEKFTKGFLKSLETPIIISPDDSEEVAALKRAVRETKIELKARYDAGEDIAKIMNDTNRQMKELALYKEELRRMVAKESRSGKSAEEVSDLYAAANKMLADRGVAPLRVPSMLKHRLELQAIKEKGKTK